MLFLYAILCLGALTTLYPFALMVSTGLKGATDQNDSHLVPAYLQDDAELFTKYISDKYSGDAAAIAGSRIGARADRQELARYRSFLLTLPVDQWVAGFRTAPNGVTSRLQTRYQSWLRNRFRNDLRALNRAYVEEAVGFQTVVPPNELWERKTWKPPRSAKFEEWLKFKETLGPEFRLPVRLTRIYQEAIRVRYQNRFSSVPSDIARSATSFETLRVPPGSVDRKLVPERYWKSNAEYQWGRTEMSIEADERQYVTSHPAEIRREFAGRNFGYVVDYVLLNGRAVLNTAIFCLLAIATQLIVNPLAAYGLSRYPIKASGAILIFLLATMAFPAEVGMIPSFLLLKDLGLLNTFAALVLPTAASGYMIFLLKGFFDSLPPELFEAGSLDGAPEWTMLWRIALPLSRPVMGYLALLAFMGAYSAFIYAFLVAQDQKIWTLMVWIYQLQNSAPRAVMMAALSLAAIPTLVVFLCAQRAVTRGIVLPDDR
jgi:multiple sugar transport system permease protein